MKKKSLIIILLLLVFPVMCFAETTVMFQQLQNSFIVDLASEKYKSHAYGAKYSAATPSSIPNSNYYFRDQISCVLGVRDIKGKNQDITLKLELVSGEWFYVYDERYKRPFGIDVFPRYANDLGGGNYDLNGVGNEAYSGRLGIQTNSSGNEIEDTVTIPASVANNFAAFWWDICIVFDPAVDTVENTVTMPNGDVYELTPTDGFYTAELRATITCGDINEVYSINLNGYYKPSNVNYSTTNLSMNVSPLSTAKTIDIESIFGNNINWPIANYGMTTTSTATNGKKPLPSGWIDLFLSSSNNALYTAPELFTLRHITTNGSVSFRDTSHNSIRFNAVLSSARGYLASDANKTKGVSITYDGTDYYGNPNTQSKYLEIGPVHQTNQGGTVFTRWYDSGTISVNIPSGQIINGEEVTVQGLVSGQYTSNIFLHIVSNL